MIKVELRELGTIEYQSCYNKMIDLINESPQFHSIWVLEHEPVFTLGISEKEIHGNLPEAQLVSLLQIGKDNKKTVSNILGQPTFAGTLGDNSFYYVGTVNSKVAFLYPSVHELSLIHI